MNEAVASTPVWRRLIGFNLLSGIVLGIVGFYVGWWLGHQIHARSLDFFEDTNQNDVALMLGYIFAVLGFLGGLGFANYPLARMVGRGRTHVEGETQRRRALLPPLHRPQGRRHPVPLRGRALLLHRRAQRDADPDRAAAPDAAGVRRRQLPDPGRPARHDDDGDHDLGRARPVRQLLRAADDRRPADGLPADRVADLLAADGGRDDPDDDPLLRRLPDRLDRLRAAQRPGQLRLRLLHLLLRPGRDLDDPAGRQHDHHDRQHARPRADLAPAADLLLGGAQHRHPDGARGAGPDRRAADGRLRPRRADLVLPRQRRRQPVPVPEPVLVLRPPGGLRAGAARLRRRAGDPAGLRAQTALGLPRGGGGHRRGRPAQLLRLAAPPLRQRPQLLAAALLHVLHRGDLGADRARLPGRDGDPLAGEDPLHGADAVLPRLVLQLLRRRRLRRLPLRRAERRRHPRQLLRHGPFPLHDHGRAGLHLLRRDLLLGAEDVRRDAERTAGQDPLLGDVHLVQLDLLPALRARPDGDAAPRRDLSLAPAAAQRLGLDLGLRARRLDARLPRQRRLLAADRAQAGAGTTPGTRSRWSGRRRRRSRPTTTSASRRSTPTPTNTAFRPPPRSRPRRRPRDRSES